ncbi:acetylornithine/succinyldiaminopimelate transaminase [uncultured Ruegeria sp.]|uniref:acetylornithine/succinyldiaminopimelate transaminase n=1 Tax=uncultured Ruegeria sp. TaxID=259304 RepID=UPI00260DC296|nr:acetylornithine/succinyldiaminopimelate transaminase [uncultured Ruegeria sp.]
MNTDVKRSDFDRYMVPNYKPQSEVMTKGQGAKVTDQNGRDYIDLAGGIAVNALGHCHPALVNALKVQAENIWHLSNLFTNAPALQLARRLTELTFAERVFFANSGAEANEAALKMARRYAQVSGHREKIEIISFNKGFHGRTFFTVSVGGKPEYSDGFGPKPSGITHLPFNDVDAVEEAIGPQTCAVILEPVQGEGGVVLASNEFVCALRRLCNKYDALLIFDEVQTGVGRTGPLYDYMDHGISPDILTSAKGLGGGFPIGATLTTAKIAAVLQPGTHASTYGGNPLGAAVSNAVLDVLTAPGFEKTVSERSRFFFSRLAEMNDRLSVFKDIRGKGLLIGAELSGEIAVSAQEMISRAFEVGVLITAAGPRTLRFCPPLTISDDEIGKGLDRIEAALVPLASNATLVKA